ncbi:MAG: phosphate acyltransferase [Bacillota bacterium]|nr:phosphate acyltransferase [Bacillota bacterium]
MIIRGFAQLADELSAAGGRRPALAVAGAGEPQVLAAVIRAAGRGLLDYLLVGQPAPINAAARAAGASLDPSRIVAADGDDTAACAVRLVREGRAQLLMKGNISSSALLRQAVDRERGLRGPALMTHIAALQLPAYHKLMFYSDGGVIPHPDLAKKRIILDNALQFARRLGYARPKVALLTAAEQLYADDAASADAAELARQCAAGEHGVCDAAGPISFDLATAPEAARRKDYRSPVAGDADILITPDIHAGNLLGKALTYFGGALMAGLVMGARVPIVMASRGCDCDEQYYSIILALRMLQAEQQGR